VSRESQRHWGGWLPIPLQTHLRLSYITFYRRAAFTGHISTSRFLFDKFSYDPIFLLFDSLSVLDSWILRWVVQVRLVSGDINLHY
jgi:hypothetical protein